MSEQRGPDACREGEARAGAKADAHVKYPFPPVAPGLSWVGTFPGLRAGVGVRGASGRMASRSRVSPGQVWETNQRCRGSKRACWRARAGGRRMPQAGPWPGRRLEPKVKSKSLRLAGSCSGFQHRWDKEPVPVTSAFYSPETSQGDGASDKGMPGVGEERRLWSQQGRESVHLAHLQSRTSTLTPFPAGLCLGAARPVGPQSQRRQ